MNQYNEYGEVDKESFRFLWFVILTHSVALPFMDFMSVAV